MGAETERLLLRPVTWLAARVRAGELAATELAEAALAAIERLDPGLGAFSVVDPDAALRAAAAVRAGDGLPLAGVPFALKDLGVAARGLRLTNGSHLFDVVPEHDSHLVRRLRAAGAVIVGRTTSSELGVMVVTEPARQGPARNPLDRERTPGGSSGGSAAAVAAGMVPAAHGSDGGGSIRIPAACCGLVGLKPSRGRVSLGPDAGDSYLATQGALTRSVADAAALLDVLAGPEPGDATWAPPPGEPFAAAAEREPGRLRIALALEPPVPARVDPESAGAARAAADLLAGLGHEVGEAAPPYPPDLFPRFTDLWAAMTSAGVLWGEALRGRPAAAGEIEPLTRWLHERALALPAPRYLASLALLQRWARTLVEWCEGWDAVLVPALGRRPPRIGELAADDPDPETLFWRGAEVNPYSFVWNATGQPAISLPLFTAADGLPLAVQLVGRPAGEGPLLALAAQLEAAHPWPAPAPR